MHLQSNIAVTSNVLNKTYMREDLRNLVDWRSVVKDSA